jgi:hypothetical protein
MANDITEGLRRAVTRGEPIEHAKQTFVNAGYAPSEVEQAARMLNSPVQEVVLKGKKPKPAKNRLMGAPPPKTNPPGFSAKQKVSEYKVKPKFDWILILMIFIFLVLIGVLVAVFFFKPQLVEFFHNLF